MGTVLHLRTINQTTEPRSQTNLIWQIKVETAGGGGGQSEVAVMQALRRDARRFGHGTGFQDWRQLTRYGPV
jgi:hypothetical protein